MTNQTKDHDRRRPGSSLHVILLAIALLGGCRSEQAFLLDSDVPIPEDSSGRATFGIKRTDGLLTGVDTVFATKVDDPGGRIDVLGTRFAASGWTLESKGETFSTATAVFAKSDRRCRVRAVRNELDPDMSRIAYNVWTVAPTRDETGSRKVDG